MANLFTSSIRLLYHYITNVTPYYDLLLFNELFLVTEAGHLRNFYILFCSYHNTWPVIRFDKQRQQFSLELMFRYVEFICVKQQTLGCYTIKQKKENFSFKNLTHNVSVKNIKFSWSQLFQLFVVPIEKPLNVMHKLVI